jgi:hypothetical protein
LRACIVFIRPAAGTAAGRFFVVDRDIPTLMCLEIRNVVADTLKFSACALYMVVLIAG